MIYSFLFYVALHAVAAAEPIFFISGFYRTFPKNYRFSPEEKHRKLLVKNR
jgi:hypothetical protein